MESGFGFFLVRRGGCEEAGEGFAEERPGLWAEGHQGVQGWGLADRFQGRGQETGFDAGVEVEKVGADGCTEVLPVFDLERCVGEVGRGKSVVGSLAAGSQLGWAGTVRLAMEG